MPKKIRHESFKYCFLKAAAGYNAVSKIDGSLEWHDFLSRLSFRFSPKNIDISWSNPHVGEKTFSVKDALFYKKRKTNYSDNLSGKSLDLIKKKNDFFFNNAVKDVAILAGFVIEKNSDLSENNAKNSERDFHDEWAISEDVEKLDIIKHNEVCTAPEMRYIIKRLGNLQNKTLLDIGCGLGEASVYFAKKGAKVTSSDLSQGMLDITNQLAEKNNTTVTTHLADAEDLGLSHKQQYDIIYTGNLLHHVDIEKMIMNIKPHLKPKGIFVSWDPLAYNPAINIYRMIATDVRTPDEHPLKWRDIKLFNKYFSNVERKYFWFSTLIIFVIMALIQKRNPNKERFWKVITQEGNKWRWLYKPLEILDSLILFCIPPLRLLCWNVVLIGMNPISIKK